MHRFSWSEVAVLLLCLLGTGTVFLPWAEATVGTFDPQINPQPDGSYQLSQMTSETHLGYRFWHGIATGCAFLGLLLFLIATGSLQPAPWWRWVVLLLGGAGVLGVVITGTNSPHRLILEDLAAGRMVSFTWGSGTLLAVGLACVVMVLAAVQLRSRIGSRTAGQQAPT